MPFKNIVWSAFAGLAAFNIFILVMFGQIKNSMEECKATIEDSRRTENFVVDEDLEILRREIDSRLSEMAREIEEQGRSQAEIPQVTTEDMQETVNATTQALGFRVDNLEEDIKGIYNAINDLRLDINRSK